MRPVRDERGFALLTTMVVLVLILSAAITLVSLVDTQTRASVAQRQRDSAFNLAESVLAAQVFSLAREWPGAGRAADPYAACTQASATARCPDATVISGTVSPDVQDAAAWRTSVHDNGAAGGAAFYSEALIGPEPGYDRNGDGRVWVRSSATAKGRTRVLVALVGAEQQEEPILRAALIAGRLEISNNGSKTLIDAHGGLVAVRCTPLIVDLTACLGHRFGAGKHKTLPSLLAFLATQVAGATPVTGYTGAAALEPAARARLRATAIADGTWFAGCPSADRLGGRVVYVESGTCTYTGNTAFNSAAAPGLLLVNAGSVSFGGTTSFHGVVYAANATGSSGFGVQTFGNATVHGGVLIDGGATMLVGSSGLNIVFDANAFGAVASYSSAGVLQNTWREVQKE